MAVATTLVTYADGTRMDDFTAAIFDVDPVDTPFTSNRPVVKMQNTIHEMYYDQLYLVSANHTVYEGSDTAAWWNEAPTTQYFITEALRVAYKMSEAEYKARRKPNVSPFAREREKAAKVLKNVFEERAIMSTVASGASGTARRMSGIIELLASYTYSNGTIAFTESGMNSRLIDRWNDGIKIDELFLPMQLKRKFSAFTGVATVVNTTDASDKRIVNAKNMYESDATPLMKTFVSRVLTNFASAAGASDAARQLYFGVQGDLIKNGIFTKVNTKEDPPDSMYDTYRGKLQMEATVMLAHPKGGFVGVNEM